MLRQHRQLGCTGKNWRINFLCSLNDHLFTLLCQCEHGNGSSSLEYRTYQAADHKRSAACDYIHLRDKLLRFLAPDTCEVSSDKYKTNIFFFLYQTKLPRVCRRDNTYRNITVIKLIRPSKHLCMIFFASWEVSHESFETLLNTGHQSATGSPTSTTSPSFTTTRVFPNNSIICGISITCELVKFKQFSGFNF